MPDNLIIAPDGLGESGTAPLHILRTAGRMRRPCPLPVLRPGL